MIKVSPKDLKAKVLLTKGRIQLLNNEKEAARVTLEELMKDYGNSQEADQARGMIALMN